MDLYYDYPHVYDSGGYQHVPNYVNETYPIPYQGNVNYDERQIGFPQLFPGIFGPPQGPPSFGPPAGPPSGPPTGAQGGPPSVHHGRGFLPMNRMLRGRPGALSTWGAARAGSPEAFAAGERMTGRATRHLNALRAPSKRRSRQTCLAHWQVPSWMGGA